MDSVGKAANKCSAYMETILFKMHPIMHLMKLVKRMNGMCRVRGTQKNYRKILLKNLLLCKNVLINDI